MKKIKISTLVAMVFMLLALTGCVSIKEDYVINKNGSAVCTHKEIVDKEAYLNSYKSNLTEMGVPVTDKEIKQIESELDANMKEQGVNKEVIDGKTYYISTETVKVAKGKISGALTMEGVTAYADSEVVYMKVKKDAFSIGAEEYGVKDVAGITYEVNFTFPKEVVSTNGQKNAADAKRVTYTFPAGKTAEFFATTNKKMTKKKIIAKIAKLNQVGKVSIKKVTPVVKGNKATAKVEFKKAKSATKYKVECSTSKSFKKTVESKTSSKTKVTLSGLKKGKTYYVRVCGMKKNYAGVLVSGKWTVKKFTTK